MNSSLKRMHLSGSHVYRGGLARLSAPRGRTKPMPHSYVRGIANTGHAFANRELPRLRRPFGRTFGIGALLVVVWGSFVLFATNEERLSSSVVRRVLSEASSHEAISRILGDSISLEPDWLYLGAPRVAGQINLLQGNIDIKLRIRGSKGSGTLYFSSIRRAKGERFEILRFRVISDNGDVADISNNLPVDKET